MPHQRRFDHFRGYFLDIGKPFGTGVTVTCSTNGYATRGFDTAASSTPSTCAGPGPRSTAGRIQDTEPGRGTDGRYP